MTVEAGDFPFCPPLKSSAFHGALFRQLLEHAKSDARIV
jgi:hypothetical protein